jgi:tetratricopeptide (TPR) repeat protein
VERGLGRYEQAHTRLVSTLRSVPGPASVESVGLQVELTVNEFYRSRFGAMQEWAERAIDAARTTRVPGLIAASLATAALAHASTGRIETALAYHLEAAAIVDGMSDEELALRLDAAGWLAAAELYLDRYAEADAHASRVLALARSTGDGDPFFRLYQILPRAWYMRGKVAEAAEFLDGAIEAVRLLGTPPALAGNLFNRSLFAVAAGDFDVALATAEEAVAVTRELDHGFVTAWAAVRLAGVLLETRQPERAVELLLDRAGGEDLSLIPGVWRVYGLELLKKDLRYSSEKAQLSLCVEETLVAHTMCKYHEVLLSAQGAEQASMSVLNIIELNLKNVNAKRR